MKNAVQAYQQAVETQKANPNSEDANNALKKAADAVLEAAKTVDVAKLPN